MEKPETTSVQEPSDDDNTTKNYAGPIKSEDKYHIPLLPNDELGEATRTTLYDILPEIWEVIFDLLQPPDMENLSNTSSYFRSLLLSRRTTYLFPQLWEILAVKFGKRLKTLLYLSECKREPRAFLNTLRLVCKEWSKTIDLYGDEYLEKSMFQPDYWTEYVFDVLGRKDLQKFMQHFESTHFTTSKSTRSPFPGHAVVTLNYNTSTQQKTSTEQEWRQGREEILNFFSHYGHYVKYLVINDDDEFSSEVENYLKLKQLLEAMPNLKDLDYCLLNVSEDNTMDASKLALTGHFPKLERLRFVNMYNGTFCYFAYNELLRSNGHISRLEIPNGCLHEYDLLEPASLSNLTDLTVSVIDDYDLHLLEYARANWKLTKLNVDFSDFESDIGTDVRSRIVLLLESKWANTLVDLDLTMLSSPEEAGIVPINLNRLQHLRLMLQDFESLDFLLPLQVTLQSLFIFVNWSGDATCGRKTNRVKERVRAAKAEQQIKLFGCISKPHKTNIWKLFPNLDRLQYRTKFRTFKSFERIDYEWALLNMK